MTYDDCWTYPLAKIKKELDELKERIAAIEEELESSQESN